MCLDVCRYEWVYTVILDMCLFLYIVNVENWIEHCILLNDFLAYENNFSLNMGLY